MDVKLPNLGEGADSGTVVGILVKPGAQIKKGQSIIELETGKAVAPSELFMPPNGKPYGLNLWNNVIYTTSAQGCGGNPNYVYAFDLATRRTATFDPGSGGMWGRSGPSIGKDGTVYTGTGDGSYNPELRSYGTAIIGVKIDPKTGALKLKDYFGPPNAEYLLKREY